MTVRFSEFASTLSVETAFTVLAVARQLQAQGKDVVELEIGDSPFDSTASAKSAGVAAIQDNQSHYCPSPGIPDFRAAAASFVAGEFNIPASAENVVAGPGAKVFEQFFCEAFLNPGDGVLVFSPFFPTYPPNIARRGGRLVFSELKQEHAFRPNLDDVARFLEEDPEPSSVAVSWDPPACVEARGYNVYRNEELLLELPADTTSFEDMPESRATVYHIETVLPAGEETCEPLVCTVTDTRLPFDVPLRINAGGRTVTDEEGRTWLGDPGLNNDVLGLRADPLGGAQVVENWCAADPFGLEELGFDPGDPATNEIFQSIRWDVGADGINWVMEFPVPDGNYTVNLYFIECCCADRHFKVEMQGELVIDDIHQDLITGVSGNSIEGVEVFDGLLQIALLPCGDPECPGGVNGDALLSAIEILPEDLVLPPDEICDNGIDDDRDGRADCDDTDCSETAQCREPAGPTFVRGDANSDGSINLTDGVVPLLYLFSGGAAPGCLDSADTNDTGSIEITDAIIIFSWLFSGGAAPAEPSPLSPGYSAENCAEDPTDDGIGCDRPSPVCN